MSPRFRLILVLAFLVGGALVLWLKPSSAPPTPPIALPAPPIALPPAETLPPPPDSTPTASPQFLILAASWEPAFCEGEPDKPECLSQGKSRFDASHFSLHGLWPSGEYCGVSSTVEQRDRDGRWSQLPPVELDPATRRILEEVMPGARSQLERHEWIKHGTCYGAPPNRYFSAAILLLSALNASPVRDLFASSIGQELTQREIRQAFDAAFGKGAGQRVRLACETDGKRRLITELTIGLYGDTSGAPNLGKLIGAANPTDGGCSSGVVDPVGRQ